jgi:anti-sigma regulatory factor (Ser/Thr protein kinase)
MHTQGSSKRAMETLDSLSLAPGPDAVAAALAWLDPMARARQWPARTAFGLRLCLDEALTNIILHGFGNPSRTNDAGNIRIDVLADDARVALDIHDNGKAFDPTRIQPARPVRSLDEADIGGHGLRLMRHYLQDIQYRHADGRNHLRLTLALDPAEPG